MSSAPALREQSSPDRPSIAELVDRARDLGPLLRERAGQTEADRRVSHDSMDRLAKAGLLGLVKPARFGGFEYRPSVLVHVGSQLGRACASTAWCAMLANCNNWFAAYWPLAVQQELFHKTTDLIAGAVAPTGKCEAVEGGYLVSGKWPWASNCENSQWAFVSAMLPAEDSGPPGVGWFITPIAGLSVDQTSWFVSGMQGTGSKTLVAEQPVFVPARRVIRFNDIITRAVPGCSEPANPMANFAFSTFGAVPLASPVIGMAQGAVDIFVEMMRNKIKVAMRAGASVTAAENPFIQERVGRASTRIAAARAYLLAELAAIEDRVAAGHTPSVDERLSVRGSVIHAVRECTEAVNALVELAGASAADTSLPLQRIWRDINAASRHTAFDPNALYPATGQNLFGLPPIGIY